MNKYLGQRVLAWQKHYQLLQENNNRTFTMYRLFTFHRKHNARTPLELELYKFLPNSKHDFSIIIARFLGAFLGLNIYLYYNRLYEDEFILRDKGNGKPYEAPELSVYMRLAKIWMHLWFVTSFQLNWRDLKQQEISDKNFEVPKYKEDMMQNYRIDYYVKNRNPLFDFLLIAEKEKFSNND